MRHRTADTPKGHRNYVIIACDVLLFLAMLKWLPVEPEVARGLAVLTFIGILWLTEALHVTVTSLLVPVLAGVGDFPDCAVYTIRGGAYRILRARIEAFLALPLETLQHDRAALKAELDRIGQLLP